MATTSDCDIARGQSQCPAMTQHLPSDWLVPSAVTGVAPFLREFCLQLTFGLSDTEPLLSWITLDQFALIKAGRFAENWVVARRVMPC